MYLGKLIPVILRPKANIYNLEKLKYYFYYILRSDATNRDVL